MHFVFATRSPGGDGRPATRSDRLRQRPTRQQVRRGGLIATRRPELPSIGVSGEIRVPAEQRQAFLDDLQRTLRELFTRYGGAEGDAFKLAVACYPKGETTT